MKTTNAYAAGTKRYRILARATTKALRNWKKNHINCKVVDVTRQIYQHYATIGITFVENGSRHWTNVFC